MLYQGTKWETMTRTMESKNWYAPSEVTVRKMTEEEKRNYEAGKAKYPWRYNKQTKIDLDGEKYRAYQRMTTIRKYKRGNVKDNDTRRINKNAGNRP